MAEQREIDARHHAYKHNSRAQLIRLIYSSVDDSADQIAAKQGPRGARHVYDLPRLRQPDLLVSEQLPPM